MLYPVEGTCSKFVDVTLGEDGTVQQVKFIGGCPGNTQGVCALARGMKASEVIKRLEGIQCGNKGTSCPDQLAKVLKGLV